MYCFGKPVAINPFRILVAREVADNGSWADFRERRVDESVWSASISPWVRGEEFDDFESAKPSVESKRVEPVNTNFPGRRSRSTAAFSARNNGGAN